jgi:hypothetical protein
MKRLIFLVMPLLLSAAPKAPTGLILTPSKDSVRLDWQDRASGEHGYKIFRDDVLIAITSENISTYTDRGLKPNRQYKYTLKSTDDILNAVDNVQAKVDNNIVTLEVKGLFTNDSQISFFIDSDNNPNTGFTKTDTNIIGADYLLQANKIYKYPDGANGWVWDEIDAHSTKEYHPTSMKVKVSLDDIPHGEVLNYMGQVGTHDYKKLSHFRSMSWLNLVQEISIDSNNTEVAVIDNNVNKTEVNIVDNNESNHIQVAVVDNNESNHIQVAVVDNNESNHIQVAVVDNNESNHIQVAVVDNNESNHIQVAVVDNNESNHIQVAVVDNNESNHTQVTVVDNNNTDDIKSKEKIVIGARSVKSTQLNKATMYASVDGSGELCTIIEPCSIENAFSKLKASDVLFLRGGVYHIDRIILNNSGEKDRPIIIESYPDEVAILDGGYINPEDVPTIWGDRQHGIILNRDINYVQIRKMEIKNMSLSGINIKGSYNLVEGCDIHNNFYAGISVEDKYWKIDEASSNGYNTIRDNQVHDNSDVGLAPNGGNADGIWIGSGQHNRVIHNNVYHNSDDGIDAWRSNDSYFAYNISYRNGIADGDGNGFKLGGHWDKVNNRPKMDSNIGLRAVADHNIAYENKASGFDFNLGIDVVIKNNIAYNNGRYGFTGCKLARTKALNNISSLNSLGHTFSRSSWGGAFDSINNSWEKSDIVDFINTDLNSKDFLLPLNSRDFGNMGVYSN